jgi:hypothetical protein
MMKRFSTAVLLALCGCASQQSLVEAEAARQVVLSHLGADAKIAGPVSKKERKELEVLSQSDRDRALVLLESGATCFFVFGPDFNTVMHTKDGPIMDFIKVERIIFVSDGHVVGDFPVKKREPNQPLQRNASTRPRFEFEVASSAWLTRNRSAKEVVYPCHEVQKEKHCC